jgi:hypothetical protein
MHMYTHSLLHTGPHSHHSLPPQPGGLCSEPSMSSASGNAFSTSSPSAHAGAAEGGRDGEEGWKVHVRLPPPRFVQFAFGYVPLRHMFFAMHGTSCIEHTCVRMRVQVCICVSMYKSCQPCERRMLCSSRFMTGNLSVLLQCLLCFLYHNSVNVSID